MVQPSFRPLKQTVALERAVSSLTGLLFSLANLFLRLPSEPNTKWKRLKANPQFPRSRNLKSFDSVTTRQMSQLAETVLAYLVLSE